MYNVGSEHNIGAEHNGIKSAMRAKYHWIKQGEKLRGNETEFVHAPKMLQRQGHQKGPGSPNQLTPSETQITTHEVQRMDRCEAITKAQRSKEEP